MMSVVDVNKQFYNQLYRRRHPLASILYSVISFDQQSKSKINYKVIKEFFKEKFKDSLYVLDYGFGHGSLLLKYQKQHVLFGCDISEEAVRNFPIVAEMAGKQVKTATVEDFFSKFNDIKFDIITLSHIIEHVEDDTRLVKDLTQKLSENGVILINIPINEVWEDPKHIRKYDIKYMEHVINECGLYIKSVQEDDKLTSFFLIEEKVKGAGPLKLFFIKLLRALFSLVPLSLIQRFENTFLKHHKNQQLIVLATKR